MPPKQKPALHVESSGHGMSGMSSRLTQEHVYILYTEREREREREMYRRRIACRNRILYVLRGKGWMAQWGACGNFRVVYM